MSPPRPRPPTDTLLRDGHCGRLSRRQRRPGAGGSGYRAHLRHRPRVRCARPRHWLSGRAWRCHFSSDASHLERQPHTSGRPASRPPLRTPPPRTPACRLCFCVTGCKPEVTTPTLFGNLQRSLGNSSPVLEKMLGRTWVNNQMRGAQGEVRGVPPPGAGVPALRPRALYGASALQDERATQCPHPVPLSKGRGRH